MRFRFILTAISLGRCGDPFALAGKLLDGCVYRVIIAGMRADPCHDLGA